MIAKIARRLGFQQSVPVAVVDDWVMPSMTRLPIELAPREGAAKCLVDQFGRLQIGDSSWTLELTLAAGARWVPAIATERINQKVPTPGVIETTIQTPSGPVVQRVAAGVVDGEPAAIVEVENTGGVAIAVGLVARPLQMQGRGHLGSVAVDTASLVVEGSPAIRFGAAPASVAAHEGADGDLLQAMPDANDATLAAHAKCRSGGAQAAAVWPLPHTATLRFVVELAGTVRSEAAVPTAADIGRGWQSHLKQGLRVDVDEIDVDGHLQMATQSVLTLWPEDEDVPTAVLALAEAGFGRDAGRLFERLERCEDDERILRALARWTQLGEPTHQLEDLELILGRLAKAAHVVANNRNGVLSGEGWLDDALVALGGRLHQIDQPEVAERVQGLRVEVRSITGAADALALLTKGRDKRGVWSDGQMAAASRYVRTVRSVVVKDAGPELAVLPDMPKQWRGRPIDIFGLPIANGNFSFGLRWHGPRPALLWEAALAPEAPFRITAPGIDASFSSTEREGEVLLADPGWQTP